jgi:hypothetical protein
MTEYEQEVIERLTRIETKIEAAADHEPRIRSLENRQWALSGGLGIVGVVLGWLGYHVSLH